MKTSILYAHPDHDVVIQHNASIGALLVSLAWMEEVAEIPIGPLGLIEVGQRMVDLGKELLQEGGAS